MAQFTYRQTRAMEPRPGVTYSTTYYQQTPAQRRQVLNHIINLAQDLMNHAEATDQTGVLSTPLRGFPRTERGRGNYTAEDIITDLLGQLTAGRDIPSGMLGRWNRLFEDYPDLQIDLVQGMSAEARPRTNVMDILEQLMNE